MEDTVIKPVKLFLLGALSISALAVSHNKVHAETNTQKMDFEIQSVVSEHQVDKTKRYFDLLLDPGKKEIIHMKIRNFSDKKITVHSDLRNAYTQVGGGINFSPTTTGLNKEADTEGIIKDQDKAVTNIGYVNKDSRTIVLDAGETKTVSAIIKMPDECTKGMIYGAWHFIEYVKDEGKNRSSVSGNYAYNMAINLHGSHYKVYPELKYKTTQPIIKAGHPAMGIILDNVQPMVINRSTIKAVIQKDGVFSAKRIYQVSDQPIAPNSRLTLPISWGYDQMKPGKYTVDVAVQGQNLWNKLPMTWHFKKSLTVKADDVKRINARAIKKPVNKWIYIAAANGVLMLVSFAAIYKTLKVG